MVLEENLEGFSGYLSVEEEVFVMEDKEDGGGSRPEIFQVPAFDPEGALAAVVLDVAGMIVDLEAVIRVLSRILESEWNIPDRGARGEASERER